MYGMRVHFRVASPASHHPRFRFQHLKVRVEQRLVRPRAAFVVYSDRFHVVSGDSMASRFRNAFFFRRRFPCFEPVSPVVVYRAVPSVRRVHVSQTSVSRFRFRAFTARKGGKRHLGNIVVSSLVERFEIARVFRRRVALPFRRRRRRRRRPPGKINPRQCHHRSTRAAAAAAAARKKKRRRRHHRKESRRAVVLFFVKASSSVGDSFGVSFLCVSLSSLSQKTKESFFCRKSAFFVSLFLWC
mmetsp:Transcript_6404/g.19101  ORF Transcript_6404/g.19101 Transcript_6404/m.19101 type:complete len:243 (-) Transcript_6404:9-737(-)